MTDKTIAELREWKKQYDIFPSMAADKEFIEILSNAVPVKEVEPLAVLAEKYGWGLTYGYHPGKELRRVRLVLNGSDMKAFEAPTYAAAEAKARAYLNGLPDQNKGE